MSHIFFCIHTSDTEATVVNADCKSPLFERETTAFINAPAYLLRRYLELPKDCLILDSFNYENVISGVYWLVVVRFRNVFQFNLPI